MKRYRCKIWQACLLPLLALLLGGCSWHADPSLWNSVDKSWDGDLYLKLNVSVAEGGSGISTRAVNSPDYFEEATLPTEKLQTLRVIIVKKGTTENNDTIKYNRPYNSLSSLGSDRFKVEFATTYDIYLVGNEAGLAGLLPLTGEDSSLTPTEFLIKFYSENKEYSSIPEVYQLENLLISAPTTSSPVIINNSNGGSTPIPMTEKFTVTTKPRSSYSNAENLEVTEPQNLFITRAATKFSFIIRKNSEQTNINYGSVKSIKITGLYDTEFLFSKNTYYDPDKEQVSDNQYDGREITDFDTPDDSHAVNYIFNLTENDINTSDFEFLPEKYFTESKGSPIEKGTNDDGESSDNKYEFLCSISYNGDTFLDPVTLPNLTSLPRNTPVKIIITLNGNTIDATVTELPYSGVDLTPTFGIDRD